MDIAKSISVNLMMYLNGISSGSYSFRTNNFDLSGIRTDLAIVRSINFSATSSSTGAIPYSNLVVVSQLSNNPIAQMVLDWNPVGGNVANTTTTFHGNPQNILKLNNNVQNQMDLSFFTSANNANNIFSLTPQVISGYFGMTVDFIELKK